MDAQLSIIASILGGLLGIAFISSLHLAAIRNALDEIAHELRRRRS
jgi:hypothetical protein